jgi:N-acetylmuramoyl-L-alanine amidase
MFVKRVPTLFAGAGVTAVLAAMTLPASVGSAAEMVAAPVLSYDPMVTATPQAADARPAVASVVPGTPAAADASIPASASTSAAAAPIDPQAQECMAKVVLHEAGNQSRAGKVAVAQTLVNRLKAGRFGGSICDVVNQPGQFFQIAAFRPRRDSDGWADAMEVAHAVLSGEADTVAPGAMFFRANYAPASTFFRSRQRVAEVGAHIFYR